jgi:hypothetical protein
VSEAANFKHVLATIIVDSVGQSVGCQLMNDLEDVGQITLQIQYTTNIRASSKLLEAKRRFHKETSLRRLWKAELCLISPYKQVTLHEIDTAYTTTVCVLPNPQRQLMWWKVTTWIPSGSLLHPSTLSTNHEVRLHICYRGTSCK